MPVAVRSLEESSIASEPDSIKYLFFFFLKKSLFPKVVWIFKKKPDWKTVYKKTCDEQENFDKGEEERKGENYP